MNEEDRTIRILHIDDNEDYLDLLSIRLPLEDKNIFIDKAKSAKSALSLFMKKKYDCVLVDYEMPGMNGLEFLKAAKDKNSLIPFIFLTGQGNEEVAAQAFRLGADDYFTKDTSFAHFPRLVNSIKQNIAKYDHLNEQQKAKDAQLKQEKQLRALVSSMDELIFLVDTKGSILENFIPTDGYEPFIDKKMIGKKIVSVLPKDLCLKLNEMFKAIKKDSEGKEIEYRVRQKESESWYLIKVLPFLDLYGNFTGYLIVISDITEKVINRQKTLESEKRFRFILENTFDYTYQIDLKTGKYDYISPKISELMGVSLEEIMNTPYWGRTRILPEDYDKVRALDKKRTKSPEEETVVAYRMQTGNNQIKYFEQRSRVIIEDGRPRYVIGVFRDITESARVENINKKLFSVYKELSEELSDAVIFIADRTGAIKDIVGGKELKKKYKYSDEILKNRNLKYFLEEQYLKKNTEKILEAFSKHTHFDGYFQLQTDDKNYYVFAKAAAIMDLHNNLDRIIVLLRDVTESWDPHRTPPEDKIIIH